MTTQIKTCLNCAYCHGDVCLRTGYDCTTERKAASYAHTIGANNVVCDVNFSGWASKDQLAITINQPKSTEMTTLLTSSSSLCTICSRPVKPNLWSTYPHLMHLWCLAKHKVKGCKTSTTGYCLICGNKTKNH